MLRGDSSSENKMKIKKKKKRVKILLTIINRIILLEENI